MRQVTATEKFRAVNEGKMAKGEFVRQMRMAYPSVISQWNSYNDTVNILKNRGYISEKTGVDTYDSRMDLNISPASIDRGVRYELQGQGVDPVTVEDKELVAKVTDRVIKNLKKDPLHYINLLAKESSNVDKHDREEEVKRGEGKKDVFNGEKKADLREGKPGYHADGTPKSNDEMDDDEKNAFYDDLDSVPEVKVAGHEIRIKDEKENIITVAREIRAKYGDIPGFTGLLKDFLQTHMDDVKSGAVTDPIAEFDNFVDANYDRLDEKEDGKDGYNTDPNLTMHIDDEEWEKEMGREVNEMSPEAADAVAFLATGAGIKGASHVVGKLLAALEAGKFGEKGKALAQDIHNLAKEEVQEGEVNERGGHYGQALISVIKDMAADFDGDEVGAAEEAMEFIGQEYEIDFEFGAGESRQAEEGLEEEPNEGNKYEYERLKAIKHGKDTFTVDGETEKVKGVDADDKKRAAQLKESVKNIITKVLEEQMINEAATNELARLADDYAGFEGMKSAILDLQNIVTDIESYYDKTREKIQKVYDRLGDIRNEEGLKVGGFLAPSIESAFNKDLRPVTKTGFTKGLETPKVKTLSQADIDAARAAGDIEEEPKQTLFTPINENIQVQSDDENNYTLVSAHDKGGNTQVIVHREDLYGEPDLKKTFKISLDKFASMLQSKGGVQKDPSSDSIYFDANTDALEEFLGSLGFNL